MCLREREGRKREKETEERGFAIKTPTPLPPSSDNFSCFPPAGGNFKNSGNYFFAVRFSGVAETRNATK